MKNIIFIAPPAAGKGTVSDYLVKNFNYEHISTGDLLRDEISSGSPLGKELDKIIASGSLVSDEIMLKLMADKLKTLGKNKPFILDGFPRTLNQAQNLNEMLISNNITNNVVIYLNIDLESALKRVLGRVICPKCKRSYNINNIELKPKNNNLCDDCNVALEHRNDDNAETFKVRFQTFLENNTSILNYYQKSGILKNVDATIPLEEIEASVLSEAK